MSAVDKIRSLDRSYSMKRFYNEMGGSRQLYDQRRRSESKRRVVHEQILNNVRFWREHHPQMGSRVLYYSMLESGYKMKIGITSFEQLLSKSNMTVGVARRSGPLTSDGLGKEDYPNLANDLTLRDINELVVADITYFWVTNRWCYLFILKDVYSQRIISIIPSENMRASNVIHNLKEIEKARGKSNLGGCIFHSDNGSQYNANEVKEKILRLDMRISRSKTCSENGSCEQAHHIVKNMYLKHYGIRTFKDLQIACKKVKRLMNEERAVKQLENITVKRFEEQIAQKTMKERPIKTLYDFSVI